MTKKILLLTMLVPLTAAAAPRKMKGDDISNLLIEGQNRLRVTNEVPELEWEPDVYKDAPEFFKDNAVVASLKPPALQQPPVTFERRSDSAKPASPWYDNVLEPPVLSLHIKPGKDERKVEWTFLVKDSNGREFYSRKKKGLMPERIDWEGFANNKKPLHAGFDYAYSLSIVDEAGNPQRFAGKPFRVPSFRYRKGSRSVTLVHPEEIFGSESAIKVSKDGRGYLTEIKDELRDRYDRKIEVTVYDLDPKFALARANVIRDFIVATLDYPKDKITTQGLHTTKGNGYRYVEIVSK